MPLSGGPADKAGNRYERWWIAATMLELMASSTGRICVEPLGAAGDGVEFWVRSGRERHTSGPRLSRNGDPSRLRDPLLARRALPLHHQRRARALARARRGSIGGQLLGRRALRRSRLPDPARRGRGRHATGARHTRRTARARAPQLLVAGTPPALGAGHAPRAAGLHCPPGVLARSGPQLHVRRQPGLPSPREPRAVASRRPVHPPLVGPPVLAARDRRPPPPEIWRCSCGRYLQQRLSRSKSCPASRHDRVASAVTVYVCDRDRFS
jgi:hypothetical protein